MTLAITPNDNTAAPVFDPNAEVPKAGTPEYDAYMEAKYNAEAAAEEVTEEGSLILGKFKSQDDLIKAYTEAQAELTRVKQGVAPKAEVPKTETTTETPPAGGFDRAKYTTEIQANGALSEASYAELTAKGFDKTMVDAYIEGQKAIAAQATYTQERERGEVLATIGGEDAYREMTTWAATNLTSVEIERFNNSVAASKDAAALAVSWLADKFKSANGTRPAVRITGSNAPATSGGFASQAQAVAAMQDKRYAKDPAYRADVERKLAAMMQ